MGDFHYFCKILLFSSINIDVHRCKGGIGDLERTTAAHNGEDGG